MAADALPTPPATSVSWPDVSALLQDPAALQSLAGKIFLGVAVLLLSVGLGFLVAWLMSPVVMAGVWRKRWKPSVPQVAAPTIKA